MMKILDKSIRQHLSKIKKKTSEVEVQPAVRCGTVKLSSAAGRPYNHFRSYDPDHGSYG